MTVPVVIGRQAGATLKIGNASVSRRHAVIEKDGDRFVIADLGSRNGTFVNDVPVRRRELQHGDRVRIGDSQFFFLYEDTDEPARTSEIRFDDSEVISGATGAHDLCARSMGLMARDLSVLMKVSTTINAIRGLEELQERLLELIFEVVPAKHGTILLTDDIGAIRKMSSVLSLDSIASMAPIRRLPSAAPSCVACSKTTRAFLVSDAENNEALLTDSLIAAHSTIAPLRAADHARSNARRNLSRHRRTRCSFR